MHFDALRRARGGLWIDRSVVHEATCAPRRFAARQDTPRVSAASAQLITEVSTHAQ